MPCSSTHGPQHLTIEDNAAPNIGLEQNPMPDPEKQHWPIERRDKMLELEQLQNPTQDIQFHDPGEQRRNELENENKGEESVYYPYRLTGPPAE